jgi:uncharacterized protein YndB with AHSA1/START domain
MTKLVVKSEIIINAPAAKVWDALTKPEQTKKYMFGCETVSDWKAGSELLWKGSYEGKEMVFVKGRIVEIKSPGLLKYTVIDANASYPDIPENHLNVTYEVTAQGSQTKLVVTQDGFEGAAESEKRYKDTYNNGEGWNPVLVQIKKIVEEN